MTSACALPPGSTIGVLGSGQLGRMFALAARSLGYRIHIYSPENAPPAGPVADHEHVGSYTDVEKIRAFARQVQVVTFEFENVPSAATDAAEEIVPVRPAGRVLHLTQNRLREKTFLRDHGFPTTPFRAIRSLQELRQAGGELGFPGVLKTASFGYDGKGQARVDSLEELERDWSGMHGQEAIYEAFVDYEKELSVIAARALDGQFSVFDVFENTHAQHILDVTFAPAALSPQLTREAQELGRRILEKLEVVGLLTVELFLTRDGRLLVNELAPRTHNSGHLTIDACVTSQFEQQVRAVCGLPLGTAALRRPAAMANLLGHLWEPREPDWAAALTDPEIKLHLYGKTEARRGRKMGHLTVLSPTAQEAVRRVTAARDRLAGGHF